MARKKKEDEFYQTKSKEVKIFPKKWSGVSVVKKRHIDQGTPVGGYITYTLRGPDGGSITLPQISWESLKKLIKRADKTEV